LACWRGSERRAAAAVKTRTASVITAKLATIGPRRMADTSKSVLLATVDRADDGQGGLGQVRRGLRGVEDDRARLHGPRPPRHRTVVESATLGARM
jgi:hypothetical protein